jgi:glycosyltransferase involved in cell wall biosynthesis
MKIIYVENVRIPSERAHAYQIVQTCAWFARLGHEVVLVNPDRADDADVFRAFEIEKDVFQHIRLSRLDPLAWEWFPFKKIAYAIQRWSFTRSLKAWAAAQTADVWYTRDPAMVDVLRDKKRRFALELHDRPDYSPQRWERVKPHISSFITITRGLADELEKQGIEAARIRVAPDGYDPEAFVLPGSREEERKKLGLPGDAFVAIYTGSFYAWKGVDVVVRAWAKTASNAYLLLIGGPDKERKDLEEMIPENAKERIRLLPAVERSVAIRSLAAADIGLLTTSPKEEIGRLYTSPLKQFEYLAAGLPILASDVPSSHEILTDAIAHFYSSTEGGFVTELAAMQKDEVWRKSAAVEAKRVVLPYTWKQRAQRILEHIAD